MTNASMTRDRRQTTYLDRPERLRKVRNLALASETAAHILGTIPQDCITAGRYVPLDDIADRLGVRYKLSHASGKTSANLSFEGMVQTETLQPPLSPDITGERHYVQLFANSANPTNRMRFTLAHELAHVALQRTLDKREIEISANETEFVCDATACLILFPDVLLHTFFRTHRPLRLSIPLLADTCRRARISISVVLSRLNEAAGRGRIVLENAGLLIALDLSRKHRVNLAPRVYTCCIPKPWFLPVNKRISRLGLTGLIHPFHHAPLYREARLEATLSLWNSEAGHSLHVPASVTYVCYRVAAMPLGQQANEFSRLMLAICDLENVGI